MSTVSETAALRVVFDMDGVIFDSERLVLECWGEVCKKYGLKDMREAFIQCIGTNKVRTKEIVLEYCGADFPYDEFSRESSALYHRRIETEGLPVKKGVRELLKYLKEEGALLGLASSTRVAVVTEELQSAGLYEYFQVVVGGDQLKHSKPEPDIYLMACEQMGIQPETAYAIEDSHNGIRAAYRAGMMPVMVPDLLPATEEMREMSVAVLEDLLCVKEYFLDGKKS